jgi:hypothetical protein
MSDSTQWTAPPEAVVAFLDGDGCDDEAFANLRSRLTLATPWILDSAAGLDYTVRKLDEAERCGAVKALRIEAMRGLEAVEAAKQREGVLKDFAVHLMKGLSQELARRADVIESGEVTL